MTKSSPPEPSPISTASVFRRTRSPGDALPERAQAQMMAKLHHPPEGYPAEARAKLETITPRYAGEAEPYGRQLYRKRPEA